MGSRYEVEVKIVSAKDLKNVNWRYGPVKPYAVVWVDPKANIEDATLYIDVVHAHAAEDVKPLIGSAKIRLRDVVDDAGLGAQVDRKLELKRPSGRPHGKLEVKVSVREPRGYPYGAPPPPQPYGQPSYGYQQPAAYGQQVGYAQQGGYGQPGYAYEEKKKSKFGGMGTGLAVGAVAGALGGLALAEGFDALEDHVADEAAEKVEEDLGYDPDDF
nr:protein SRC2-like [Ipomoea batatas]GME06274.1 protein SRC2-like [Ipomoea batatas]